MSAKRSILITFAVLGIVAIGLSALCRYAPAESGKPTAAKAEKNAKGDEGKEREADRQALRKVSQDFARAVARGDARAVAGFWTEQGEYIADDGTTLRGRDAIEKAYAKFFKKNAGRKVEVTIESLRFVSRDCAVEEGYATATKGKNGPTTSSRYRALHVRENGRWLLAVVREWPEEGDSLRDLGWLIGTWGARTGDAEVRTTYAWDEGKRFLRVRFTIKSKQRTATGLQIIGKDPRTGGLRSWVFESEGGFGEAEWSWDGKRWIQEAAGVQADGSEIKATNIMTPRGKDAFTWQSVDRTLDGEELADIPPVKVTRVK